MTKAVRIENADAHQGAIIIRPQHLNPTTNQWEDAPEVTKQYLPTPADLATSYVHQRRRLIIEEA